MDTHFEFFLKQISGDAAVNIVRILALVGGLLVFGHYLYLSKKSGDQANIEAVDNDED